MTVTVESAGRRQAILDAALRAFAEKGFAAATVEDVRRLSGASVGSIYHHFGDKEGIASALYVEGLADYQRGVAGTLRRHRDAEAGIKALVRHHLRWVARNPDLAAFILGRRETEVRERTEPRMRELNREVFAATREWLEPHVTAGRIKPLPLDLTYSILLGPSQEFTRNWLSGRTRSSMRQAERALPKAAWGALAARPEGDG